VNLVKQDCSILRVSASSYTVPEVQASVKPSTNDEMISLPEIKLVVDGAFYRCDCASTWLAIALYTFYAMPTPHGVLAYAV